MNALVLLLLLLQQATVPAADPAALFATAAEHFEKREFTQAAGIYEAILASGIRSSAVEYNLGNAFYRLGRWGEARLHYERAVRLAPGDPDSVANIAFIETRHLKQALWEENFGGIDRVLWGAVTILPRELLAATGLGAWITLNLIIGWSLLRSGGRRRALRWTAGILCAAVAILALGALAIADNLAASRAYGIVTAPDVMVTSEPNRAAPGRFPAPEATKVIVTREQGEWREIALPNGTKGWVPRTAVETI